MDLAAPFNQAVGLRSASSSGGSNQDPIPFDRIRSWAACCCRAMPDAPREQASSRDDELRRGNPCHGRRVRGRPIRGGAVWCFSTSCWLSAWPGTAGVEAGGAAVAAAPWSRLAVTGSTRRRPSPPRRCPRGGSLWREAALVAAAGASPFDHLEVRRRSPAPPSSRRSTPPFRVGKRSSWWWCASRDLVEIELGMAAGCGSGRRCAEAKPRRPDLHRVRGCPPPPAVPTVSTARRQTATPRNGRYGPPRLLDSILPGDRGRAGARSTPWRSAEDDGAPRAPSTPTPRRSGGVPRPGSGAARERVPVDRQSRSSRSGAKAAVHGRVPTRPAHGFLDELGARRSLDFRRRGTRRWPCHAAAGFLIPPSCAS